MRGTYRPGAGAMIAHETSHRAPGAQLHDLEQAAKREARLTRERALKAELNRRARPRLIPT
jgi:hypothetical protein